MPDRSRSAMPAVGHDGSIEVKPLDPSRTMSHLYDTVRLQHVENRGAFLSMGESLPTQL
jgi:hypothetical protein